jgi:hypothetical protein
MKITKKDLIERFNEIHNMKFNYKYISYVNMKTKVKIICPSNHEFYQTPDNHLKGKGCPFCKGFDKYIKNINDFIIKANFIHNNKYDYSKFNYIDSKTKSIIICEEHGDFLQSSNQHLSGNGCKKCFIDSLRLNNEEIIKRFNLIHNNLYNYYDFKFENIQNKINIECKIHGLFKQSISTHLNGSGCKKCMIDKFKKPFINFKNESILIHGNIFEYEEKSFLGMKKNINIKCSKHGWFKITPDNHISKKRGCSKCSNNVSKIETKWLNELKIQLRQYIIKLDKKVYKVDGYDPLTNTIYEMYGDYWHGNLKLYIPNNINKRNGKTFEFLNRKTFERENLLKENGFNIISIWESDYKNNLIK